jgi:hypothetical protein
MALTSQLLGSSGDLVSVSEGTRRVLAPEVSDSVALIQQALLASGFDLAESGVDDGFGDETGTAVTNFKTSRGLIPNDPVVGIGTILQLDAEATYLEGTPREDLYQKPGVMALDAAQAGFVELTRPDLNLTKSLTDFFELGDRICFRLSFVLGPQAAALMGRIAEARIFTDYRTNPLFSPAADFFDDTSSSTPYVTFLLAQHPGLNPAILGGLGSQRRPDLLRNSPGAAEWYEIKPLSIAGAIAAWKKFNTIPANYAAAGLPYLPGTAYTPPDFLELASFVTDGGENLDIVLHCRRPTPGLIFWEFCVKGDYVRYFNRVRLAAGLLAILVALSEVLIPAAEVGATVAAIAQLASEIGAGALPLLTAL